MRALFAQLPADGRLTLHLACRETYPSPWPSDAVGPSWTVVVCDNARLPHPGTDVRYLYRVTGAGLAGLDDRAVVAGLCILDVTADPAGQLTWPEVLCVLDGIAAAVPTWQIEAIKGTLEPEPRYGVTLRTEAGQARPLPDAEAFDRLCLVAGPLGQRAPLPNVPAVAVGAPPHGRMHYAPTWEPSPGAAAAPVYRPEPLTAWVFAPPRQPRCCTLGSLPWLAPSSVCTWVDLCAPRRDEVLAVTRQLGLPYRAVLATLSSAPESWCHASRDHISVRVQEVRRDPLSGQIEADPLDLIVGQAIVVSVHAGPLPALIRLRRRAGQNPDYVGATALALLAAILGEVLSSPEALARWMVLDSAAVQGRAPQMAGLRRA